MERVQALALEVVGELGDARLVAHRRLRVGAGGPGLGRVLAARAMHLEKLLGFVVIGLEHVVFERPLRRDAVDVPDRVKVGFAQAEQGRAIELELPPTQ